MSGGRKIAAILVACVVGHSPLADRRGGSSRWLRALTPSRPNHRRPPRPVVKRTGDGVVRLTASADA
jgi:hypothetical protein